MDLIILVLRKKNLIINISREWRRGVKLSSLRNGSHRRKSVLSLVEPPCWNRLRKGCNFKRLQRIFHSTTVTPKPICSIPKARSHNYWERRGILFILMQLSEELCVSEGLNFLMTVLFEWTYANAKTLKTKVRCQQCYDWPMCEKKRSLKDNLHRKMYA